MSASTLSFASGDVVVNVGDRIRITFVGPYDLLVEGRVSEIGQGNLTLGGYETFYSSDFATVEVIEKGVKVYSNSDRLDYHQGDIVQVSPRFFLVYDPIAAPDKNKPWRYIVAPMNTVMSNWYSNAQAINPRSAKLVLDAKECLVVS